MTNLTDADFTSFFMKGMVQNVEAKTTWRDRTLQGARLTIRGADPENDDTIWEARVDVPIRHPLSGLGIGDPVVLRLDRSPEKLDEGELENPLR